ncbi:serine O-acetyltransferase [Eggerthella sp. YY7918]|uniref:serine O-acetyltransferase n=1 Tax=Eggerthella sp. (strain YY7918) TaxID=502558 RepID=UPI0002170FD0|nr:serine acetyltransferase [Eggerthella sp. YY7918]BAK43912.1 serine acetyltransferase [Eggerthella sp. YY7918]
MLNCMSFYRAGHACYIKHIPILPALLKYVGFLVFNSVIPPTAEIGKQSKCAYGGIGCVIHARAVIGERVVIGQNTTIGRSLDPEDFPTIGDDVYISAGARIIGNISVGNNVIVGANAVVNKSVPDNSIVAGVPAKVIRTVDKSIWDLLKNMY